MTSKGRAYYKCTTGSLLTPLNCDVIHSCKPHPPAIKSTQGVVGLVHAYIGAWVTEISLSLNLARLVFRLQLKRTIMCAGMALMSGNKYIVAILVFCCVFCLSLVTYNQIAVTDTSKIAATYSSKPANTPRLSGEASKKGKDAFVTLLYGGFLLGARVLAQSLKETGTKKDMIALCTESVTQATKDIMIADGWKIKSIGNIHNPYEGQSFRGDYFSGIFSKLYIWNMTEYERIIYLDADVLVLENIDHMFDCGTFCATYRHSDLFNAGIIVVQPNSTIFSDMMKKIPHVTSYDDGDQGFLNIYFRSLIYSPYFNWSDPTRNRRPMRMPTELNADIAIYYISNCWSIKGDVKIIHYTMGPIKPWIWWTDRLFHLNSQWTAVRMRLPEYEGYNDKYVPFYSPIFWMPYPFLALLYIIITRVSEIVAISQCPGKKYVLTVLKLFILKSTFFSHILPLPILLISYKLAMHTVPTTMLSNQAEYAFWLWSSFFILLFMGAYCFPANALLDNHANGTQRRKLQTLALFLVFSLSHTLVAVLPRLVTTFGHRVTIFIVSALLHLMVSQIVGQWVIRAWTKQQKLSILPSVDDGHQKQ